jgi:hypothetical protein
MLADDEDPSYNGGIGAVLDGKCVNCHASYKTYKGAAADGKRIVASIIKGTMPPGPDLLPEQKDMFEAWLDDGFPEDPKPEVRSSDSEDPEEEDSGTSSPSILGPRKSPSDSNCTKSRL